MNKKEFKMQLATNPVLSKWMKDNMTWIKSNPEVMMYIVRHPNGLGHFRPGQPVDNERLSKSAQQFVSQMQQERMNRSKRGKSGPTPGPKAEQGEKGKRKNLFSGFKSMFPGFGGPLLQAPPVMKLPTLKPPGAMSVARTPINHSSAAKAKRKSPLRLPKINISRAKLMETMSQTTEMLDVISALMGKIGNLK